MCENIPSGTYILVYLNFGDCFCFCFLKFDNISPSCPLRQISLLTFLLCKMFKSYLYNALLIHLGEVWRVVFRPLRELKPYSHLLYIIDMCATDKNKMQEGLPYHCVI